MTECVRFQLPSGHSAIVDLEDADLAELAWCAQVDKDHDLIYVQRGIHVNGKKVCQFLHGLIMERKLGHPVPSGYMSDHVNFNGLDNRRENLRLASYGQNQAHSRLHRRRRTSGFRGVYWERFTCKWVASTSLGGKTVNLGKFDAEETAARAYDDFARKAWPGFAQLNFPDALEGAIG